MAESKRPGGLYYREDGTAVDANGEVIEGAPKRKADTVRVEPAAASGVPMEERIAAAAAAAAVNALKGGTDAKKAE